MRIALELSGLSKIVNFLRSEKKVANDGMRLNDRDFDILTKLVNKHYKALKEVNMLDDSNDAKLSFFKTLSAKLTHARANGIASNRAVINATHLKAYCGDKEIFLLDLVR